MINWLKIICAFRGHAYAEERDSDWPGLQEETRCERCGMLLKFRCSGSPYTVHVESPDWGMSKPMFVGALPDLEDHQCVSHRDEVFDQEQELEVEWANGRIAELEAALPGFVCPAGPYWGPDIA